jgi:acyl-CoA hydrolase
LKIAGGCKEHAGYEQLLKTGCGGELAIFQFYGNPLSLFCSCSAEPDGNHARCNAVTDSGDRLDFHYPAFCGESVDTQKKYQYGRKTSMEIGVRTETEDLLTGKIRRIASAYLTLVGLDETGHTKELPRIICETEEEKRRNTEAIERREARLREKKKEGEP